MRRLSRREIRIRNARRRARRPSLWGAALRFVIALLASAAPQPA